MKTRLPALGALATVLALGATSAFAHDGDYDGDMFHRIAHENSQPPPAPHLARRTSLAIGSPVPLRA